MTADPYSPPAEAGSVTPERRSVLSFTGLILSVMLTAILILLTIGSAYQNYTLVAGFDYDWQRLPTYVLLLPWITLVCTVVMALAAISFRRNRNQRAICWFGLTAVVYFGVPPILLSFLY